MNKTYIPALISVTTLAGLHLVASDGHWYVRYPGFDILMHILGGVGLAFSIYWILVTSFPKFTCTFWHIVELTFLAGFCWEAFETMYDIAGAPVWTEHYYLDSIKDLVNDTLGAIIASYFVKK